MPPAGWYDDPVEAGRLRWWDGAQWTADRWPRPPIRDRAERVRIVKRAGLMALPLLVVFDVTAVASLNRWWHHLSLAMVLYEVFLVGPLLGVFLLAAPVVILTQQRPSLGWLITAEVLIAAVIVWACVTVTTDEHSTAGLTFIYVPPISSAVAVAASGLSRLQLRHRNRVR